MPLITSDSVVLQSFAYGDTSKVLRLLTRTHGVQAVIAKGALRPRSRYGGVLDPFTEGIATFFFRDSRDLQTLSGFELGRSAQRLGRDLMRFGGASLLAEIVLRTGSEQADPELFDSVRRAFRRLAEAPAGTVEVAVLAETWALIDRLGFAPALEECIACGRAIASEEATTFDYAAGGVRCDDCAAGSAGRPLPHGARATLHALVRGEAAPLVRTAAHWRLLARYLSHHVVEGSPLRALNFVAEVVAQGGENARE